MYVCEVVVKHSDNDIKCTCVKWLLNTVPMISSVYVCEVVVKHSDNDIKCVRV